MNWRCCSVEWLPRRGIDRDIVSGVGIVSGGLVPWGAGVFCVGVVCDGG